MNILRALLLPAKKYSEEQPRDDRGRFGSATKATTRADNATIKANNLTSSYLKDKTGKITASQVGRAHVRAAKLNSDAAALHHAAGSHTVAQSHEITESQHRMWAQRYRGY